MSYENFFYIIIMINKILYNIIINICGGSINGGEGVTKLTLSLSDRNYQLSSLKSSAAIVWRHAVFQNFPL